MVNLLQKVQSEYMDSRNATMPRRDQKKKDLKLYSNQSKSEEKLSNSLLSSTVDTYAAMSFSDKMMVSFSGWEWGDKVRAENIQALAEFDYIEMGMDEDEAVRAIDRGLMGVDIRLFTHWDKNTQTPVYKLIDPLSWFPDPRGYGHTKNFRFMGFECETTISELKNIPWYKNLSQIDSGLSKEMQDLHQEQNTAKNFSQSTEFEHDENAPITILVWFTKVNGIPTNITLANNCSLIIKEEPFYLENERTKKDITKATFPVSLTYRKVRRNDPFGISIADEIRDKQRAATILDNLMLIAQKNQSIGFGIEYDKNHVRRKDLLNRDPFSTRLVPSTQPWSVAPIKMPWVDQTAFQVAQSIERWATLSTGISSIQSGVMTDEGKTATEIQTIQANSNLRQLFSNKTAVIGEKDFWEKWYGMYVKYFSKKTGKKEIVITGTLVDRTELFYSSDIFTKKDPNIKVESKNDKRQQTEKYKADNLAQYGIDTTDVEASAIGRIMTKRLTKEMLGWDKGRIMATYPHLPEESRAWDDVELINEDEYVPVEDLNEDHMTFIVIYQNAKDTPAKYASIAARRLAQKLKQQAQAQSQLQAQQADQNKQLTSQSQAQMSNSAIQQNAQQKASSQNVSNIS